MQKNELFDFMLKRVEETSKETGLKKPQAFIKWFSELYFPGNQHFFATDGNRDGKVDGFFQTNDGRKVEYHILNSKFTEEFSKVAPPRFYEEVSHFYSIFSNKDNRAEFLQKAVKAELRNRYIKLFEAYDDGDGSLIFVTNHKRNDAQVSMFRKKPVKIFHLEDIFQFMVDDLDNAMPKTKDLFLYDIHSVLSPDKDDTEVATSIVFARLIDFVKYMQKDPNDFLFARNIRLNLMNTNVNKGIRETFRSSPKEFAFSNNGITVLCESHTHNPGKKELEIVNPRVVNGSQTLHSIRDVPNPSESARVMLRIIEIPAIEQTDLPGQRRKKREIIDKISLRSNQQNPIKLWNLVANDDYQLELFRFFRRRGLFYERREKEFNQRSRELRSNRISRGPTLKGLTQIIACYYWNNKRLGPALARNLSKLFDTSTYDIIRGTKPETAYQLYLLNELAQIYFTHVVHSKPKLDKFYGYINQSLLSLLCKVLQSSNIKFGDQQLTEVLNYHLSDDSYARSFKQLVQLTTGFIEDAYNKEAVAYRKREERPLSVANFFKSPSLMANLMERRISFSYAQLCNRLFASLPDGI